MKKTLDGYLGEQAEKKKYLLRLQEENEIEDELHQYRKGRGGRFTRPLPFEEDYTKESFTEATPSRKMSDM